MDNYIIEHYLLWKALHIIAIICWMAGLLYLPRLFVYHSQNSNSDNIDNMLQIMEKRLYYYIMMPAMIFSFVFGTLLIIALGGFNIGIWLHIKMTLVIGLLIVHLLLGYYVKQFKDKCNKNSSRFYKIINEIPTVLMIAIVFIVTIK